MKNKPSPPVLIGTHQTTPINAGTSIVFKRWLIEPGMSIAPLIRSHRRGIYVLEFLDGSRYVGLSTNVITRFSTHVHGSSHHEGWTDVVALNFREMPEGDLREAEAHEILRQQSLGYELRNKDLNFGHHQPSALDALVTVENQKHWALGDGNYDLPDLAERAAAASTGRSRLRAHVPDPVSPQSYDGVLDDLAFCLSHLAPDAVNLEGKYWTLTDWPSTAGGRMATLSVGVLELAYVPRQDVDFEVDGATDSAAPTTVVFVNLPPHLLAADEDGFHFRFDGALCIAERVDYRLTSVVRVGLPAGSVRRFFATSPELLAETRRFVLNIMRYRDSAIFRRHHSRALAGEVFAHQARTRS